MKRPGEQFIELLLASSDHEGNPIKGQKTRARNTRYKNNAPITLEFPAGWKVECSIVEGMFMINSAPLGSHCKFGEYNFLIKCYIIPHFSRGTKEVHVIFNNPGSMDNIPNYFEQ